jgi:peroxiredoxin
MTARMRRLSAIAVLLALGVALLITTSPAHRKSPELKFLEPSGKETLLSSFRGKVVVIEFLLVKCSQCLRVAQTINELHSELGARGFQPIGIAFDNDISGPVVAKFAQYFKITYPVGYTSSESVDSYLGRAEVERFRVPQMVVIDRKGVIRARSRPVGEKNLEDKDYLRNLIDSLLKEGLHAEIVAPMR